MFNRFQQGTSLMVTHWDVSLMVLKRLGFNRMKPHSHFQVKSDRVYSGFSCSLYERGVQNQKPKCAWNLEDKEVRLIHRFTDNDGDCLISTCAILPPKSINTIYKTRGDPMKKKKVKSAPALKVLFVIFLSPLPHRTDTRLLVHAHKQPFLL